MKTNLRGESKTKIAASGVGTEWLGKPASDCPSVLVNDLKHTP